jgi:lysophospholipase L1-like esterase
MARASWLALAPLLLLLLLAGGAGAADSMRADDARVSRMGRTVAAPDGTLRFGYPGVTLAVAFTGSRLSVEMAGGAGSLVDVVVDGAMAATLRPGPQARSVEVLKDAAPGPHRVELVHRTETWLGVVSVAGFVTDGRFAAPPPLPARRMLVLGDSVTCGADMERAGGDKNNPAWWNARLSYGMLVARALDAQVQLVCHGGRGLVRSWNGRSDEAQLPAFYEMAIAAPGPSGQAQPWNQAGYDPELILVAIGTNDFTQGIPERAAYVAAYEAFVRRLLDQHAHARIVLTEGAILEGEKKDALSSYLAETVARIESPRVRTVPSGHHPGDAADAHPTTAQHAAMADELAPLLRALMGW